MSSPVIALVAVCVGALCLFLWQYFRPKRKIGDAAERVLTLLFVDIVGFSQSVEMQPPREVFRELRDLFERLTADVDAFGGDVDRTLGDGMLCIFGMREGEDLARSAERAVACAVKIQRDHLRRALARIARGESPSLPLRIGINTAAVYIGNLDIGGEDSTVIGNGVNLAQRLEAACESFRVLIGPTTYSLLRASGDKHRIVRKRLIPVKHHREALEVFEVDPFPNQEADVRRSLTAHWERLGFQRMEERWDLPDGTLMHIDTEYGPGQLMNFSLNGFGLRLPQYLGRQLALGISLGHDEPGLRAKLERSGIEEIVGEVRWARPLDRGGYLHGILIRNLGPAQRQELLTRLLRWLESIDSKVA